MTKDEKTALIERITALEARIEELERCKHEGHTIGDEALQQITTLVKLSIASALQAPKEG
jgi:BMFP domain-containing protein YqiC